MGNFMEQSKLFNAFILLVFLAHFIQLVWNQPLITRQSPIAPIPFNPELAEQNSDLALSLSSGSSSLGSSISSSSSSPQVSHHHQSSSQISNTDNPPTNTRIGRATEETTNSLCSIFRTFLDSQSVQCRVLNSNVNGQENIDSNALIQIRGSSSSNNPRLIPANSRIDHFDHNIEHHHHHSSSLQDDVDDGSEKGSNNDDGGKILQDKTAIIVPDRPCPPGQRRDPRGYCRTILRIRTYNGQQISVRPIRYYYRRFVAIPALHFILP